MWAIDPPDGDGVEERIRAPGEPAGVVQLLDHKPPLVRPRGRNNVPGLYRWSAARSTALSSLTAAEAARPAPTMFTKPWTRPR